MDESKLINFHGPLYSEGPWGNKKHPCCRLCKTKNPKAKKKHWSLGLCRSCYRRLSINHRLYNDAYNKNHARTVETRKSGGKKSYKLSPEKSASFNNKDIETLLERYDFKCAYCRCQLQDHNHTAPNALQIEYINQEEETTLVPICRGCNCSKKNINDEEKLKRWATAKSIPYPFVLIPYKP